MLSQHVRDRFCGDPALRPEDAHDDSPRKPEPYVASAELKQAVNLALFLQRPLLLEGEPGCGKTRLARAVAYELGWPFYSWSVRSTSKAQDGLYNYNAILRLHDVQTQSRAMDGAPSATAGIRQRDPGNPWDYCDLGAIGKAFQVEDRPAVVLIDEVDKADLDFPNDLLAVLEEPWEFWIPETYTTVSAVHPPLVVITSNKEKGNLPAPFLRRCIYHYVSFPSRDLLEEIVAAHYRARQQELPSPDPTGPAITRFLQLREEGGGLHKKPGTSEFLDWLDALCRFEPAWGQPATLATQDPIPYPELLFKLKVDWQRYARAA